MNGQDVGPIGGNGSAMGDGRTQHDDSTTWVHTSGSQPFECAAGKMRCRRDCHGPDCRGNRGGQGCPQGLVGELARFSTDLTLGDEFCGFRRQLKV